MGIDYKAVIADLKARKEAFNASIDQAIAAIENVMAIDGSSTVVASPQNGSEGKAIDTDTPFFGLSIAQATEKYLAMNPGKSRTTNEIVEALPKGGLPTVSENLYNTIASALRREIAKPNTNVVSIKRGVWGLKEWYPGYRRARQKSEDEYNEAMSEYNQEQEGERIREEAGNEAIKEAIKNAKDKEPF